MTTPEIESSVRQSVNAYMDAHPEIIREAVAKHMNGRKGLLDDEIDISLEQARQGRLLTPEQANIQMESFKKSFLANNAD